MNIINIYNPFVVISSVKIQIFSQILKQLDNINYAYIKGDALSLQAYKKLGERIYSDIDILIHKRSISQVENILREKEFITSDLSRKDKIMTLTNSHQTATWKKDINQFGKIIIDINHDIFWGEYTGRRINIDEYLNDTIEIDIYGCKIKTLSSLKAMIQLILHHYKEMNSIYHIATHNCINSNMLKDVYYLLINNINEISIDKLYSISLKYEIIPYVFYILYYTNMVFNDKLLQRYVEAFRTAQGEDLLDYYGLAYNEKKLWKIDFKTRLDSDNLFEYIKPDLNKYDIEKLERNKEIFK